MEPTRQSAVMAGMEVVVTKCDDRGNIDMDDMKAHAEKHAAHLGRCHGNLSINIWRI